LATIRCKNALFEDIQAILFDKDGTLANSEVFLRNLAQRRSRLIDAQIPGVQEPLLMAFGVEGDRLDPAGLMAVGTRQENEVAAAAYVAETGRGWIESLRIIRSAFNEADRYPPTKAEQTLPIAGAANLLAALAMKGLKIAVLSADSTHQVQDFIQTYQWVSYFQVQLGIDGYNSKSDPALLDKVLASLEVKSQQILVVGDAETDVEVAHNLGAIGCVGFTGGWSTAVSLNQADVCIEQLSQIEILT
jgi:phosphoglycolate phosphatase